MASKGTQLISDFAFLSIVDGVRDKGMPSYEELGINGINSAVYNLILSDILAAVDPYLIMINAEIATHLKKIIFMTLIELISRKLWDGDMKFSRVMVKHLAAQFISYLAMRLLPSQVIAA